MGTTNRLPAQCDLALRALQPPPSQHDTRPSNDEPAPRSASLLSASPGTAAVRLLFGSHLLLLVQSALLLCSPGDLGGARAGFAATSIIALIALLCAMLGRFPGRSRKTRGRRHGA